MASPGRFVNDKHQEQTLEDIERDFGPVIAKLGEVLLAYARRFAFLNMEGEDCREPFVLNIGKKGPFYHFDFCRDPSVEKKRTPNIHESFNELWLVLKRAAKGCTNTKAGLGKDVIGNEIQKVLLHSSDIEELVKTVRALCADGEKAITPEDVHLWLAKNYEAPGAVEFIEFVGINAPINPEISNFSFFDHDNSLFFSRANVQGADLKAWELRGVNTKMSEQEVGLRIAYNRLFKDLFPIEEIPEDNSIEKRVQEKLACVKFNWRDLLAKKERGRG